MAAAAWVTVKVWPAIVNVPVLCVPVLPATAYWTLPEPVPPADPLMPIQLEFDALVQTHALPDGVTATVPWPPDEPTVFAVGLMLKVQADDGAVGFPEPD